MKYLPLYTNVLLKLILPEDKLATTLISSYDTEVKRGLVLSVGDGTEEETVDVDEDDVVLFYTRDARPILLGENTYFLIPCRNILLIEKSE